MTLLDIKDLHAEVEDKEILKGINLKINKGEIHVIMGPNGAGKSTLASVLVGHPNYTVTKGEVYLDGQNILDLSVDKRARAGIFLSFQYPEEIPGLTLEDFLRSAKEAVTGEKQYFTFFHKYLVETIKKLNIDPSYCNRHLNVGYSGGEKKKNEILQMAILEPKIAILDEADSGLDRDATQIVFEGLRTLKRDDASMIIITHYDKVLEYLQPDYVHILVDGKIKKNGGKELIEYIEKNGFEEFKNKED